MDKAYKTLTEKQDDNLFSLETMVVVRKIFNFKSFYEKDQFKLQLIKLILDNNYQEVEKLLKDRKEAIDKLYQEERGKCE